MTKTPTRKQRAHDVLPAGYTNQAGRIYWRPSPTLRKAGWSASSAQSPRRRHLDARGRRHRTLPRDRPGRGRVAPRRSGPAGLRALCPGRPHRRPRRRRWRAGGPAGLNGPTRTRSAKAMLDAYYACPDFAQLGHPAASSTIAASWRASSRCWAPRSPASNRARPRSPPPSPFPSMSWPRPSGAAPASFSWRSSMRPSPPRQRREHMAHGVMACVSAWLSYCVRRHRILAGQSRQADQAQGPGRPHRRVDRRGDRRDGRAGRQAGPPFDRRRHRPGHRPGRGASRICSSCSGSRSAATAASSIAGSRPTTPAIRRSGRAARRASSKSSPAMAPRGRPSPTS